jgi:hypothetical protein
MLLICDIGILRTLRYTLLISLSLCYEIIYKQYENYIEEKKVSHQCSYSYPSLQCMNNVLAKGLARNESK